jgi:hypothetical protein
MYRYLKRYRRTGTGIVKSKEEKDCFAAMDRAAPEPCRQGRICLDHITCHGLESEKRIQNDSSAVPFLPGTPAPLDLDSRISASDSSWHCASACRRRQHIESQSATASGLCQPVTSNPVILATREQVHGRVLRATAWGILHQKGRSRTQPRYLAAYALLLMRCGLKIKALHEMWKSLLSA